MLPPPRWIASAGALTLVLLVSGCASAFEAGQNASNGSSSEVVDLGLGEETVVSNVATEVTKTWVFPEGDLVTTENDYLLAIDLEIQNNSNEDVAVSSLVSFALVGQNGKTYSLSIFSDVESRLDATVKPGRKLVGTLVYDVDRGTDFYLNFKPSLLEDGIEFLIEQPAQSK
jgi:hypothetical protein